MFQSCGNGLTLICDEMCKNYLDSPYQNILTSRFCYFKCPGRYKCAVNMKFFNGIFN